MAHVPLPSGCPDDLQRRLWDRHGIEVPIVSFAEDRFIRVSCHLYNDEDDIERLVRALQTELT